MSDENKYRAQYCEQNGYAQWEHLAQAMDPPKLNTFPPPFTKKMGNHKTPISSTHLSGSVLPDAEEFYVGTCIV